LLRSIQFEHDPSRPDTTSYTALVHVAANDGELTGPTAVTLVEVTVTNQSPVILLDAANQVSSALFVLLHRVSALVCGSKPMVV